MEYKIIFTSGHEHDEELRERETRGDILLQTEAGDYYELNFVTLNRIRAEFHAESACYLEDNMVILHEVTKDNILGCVPVLHRWMFYKRWMPLSPAVLDKYYMPREPWVVYSVVVDP